LFEFGQKLGIKGVSFGLDSGSCEEMTNRMGRLCSRRKRKRWDGCGPNGGRNQDRTVVFKKVERGKLGEFRRAGKI